MRVSEVKFRSTCLKTLLASLDGSSPATVGPPVVAGAAPGQGRRLFLAQSIGYTGPTSAHNRYISVKYSGIKK
jgi:hypothetical protein